MRYTKRNIIWKKSIRSNYFSFFTKKKIRKIVLWREHIPVVCLFCPRGLEAACYYMGKRSSYSIPRPVQRRPLKQYS